MFFTKKGFEMEISRRLNEQEQRFYMEQRFRDESERMYKLENDIAKLALRITVLEGKEGNILEGKEGDEKKCATVDNLTLS